MRKSTRYPKKLVQQILFLWWHPLFFSRMPISSVCLQVRRLSHEFLFDLHENIAVDRKQPSPCAEKFRTHSAGAATFHFPAQFSIVMTMLQFSLVFCFLPETLDFNEAVSFNSNHPKNL